MRTLILSGTILLAATVGGSAQTADPVGEWLVKDGTARIKVVMGCPRCVMVTLAGDDLPKDPQIMRTLVRETKHTAGIYASVIEEGVVREGDAIELLD